MTTAHATHDEPVLHMGLPLPNGKLATWLFLVTEIMFFTGLIGAYVVLRQSAPDREIMAGGTTTHIHWPKPHDVHLVEWMGAVNTFVLICSSLTVVLAHYYIGRGGVKAATLCVGVTLALGVVFLAIKAVEYKAKYDHDILPGHIGDNLEGSQGQAAWYKDRIRGQLDEITKHPEHHGLAAEAPAVKDCAALL